MPRRPARCDIARMRRNGIKYGGNEVNLYGSFGRPRDRGTVAVAPRRNSGACPDDLRGLQVQPALVIRFLSLNRNICKKQTEAT